MYSGDEYYSDDITSPIGLPLMDRVAREAEVSYEERRALYDAEVTLWGVQAFIRGAKRPFAFINAVDGRVLNVTWGEAKRIVETKNGVFE